MNIYRIEHKNGYGIFMASDSSGCPYYLSIGDGFTNRHVHFPTPDEDLRILRRSQHDEYCAFKNKSDLKKWVKTSELNNFVKLGFDIYKIKINKVDAVIGEYQILYKKDKIINKICITHEYQPKAIRH